MKNEIIHNSIRILTEAIKEQQEQILAYEGRIPQIEIDILMGNVRGLYEKLIDLNKINAMSVNQQTPHSVEPVPENRTIHTDELIAHISEAVPELIITEIKTSTPVEIIAQQSPVEIIPEPVTPQHIQQEELIANIETLVEESPTEISSEVVMPQATLAKERSKEYSKPSTKVYHTASLFDDMVTVGGKFKESPSLRDRFSVNNQDSSITDKLLKNPVSDLKKSIGINEKFAFINELFDGDLNSYNEAIDNLNNSSNYQNAQTILETDLSSKYDWNSESDAFQKLKSLVERRFSA